MTETFVAAIIGSTHRRRLKGGFELYIDVPKIETILAEKRMTKTEYSKKCGMSQQNVCTVLKRGTCEPRTAGKLAAGLCVRVEDILKEV